VAFQRLDSAGWNTAQRRNHMREVDLTTWRRRRHFDLFRAFDHPHFSMCANLDLTAYRALLRESGVSFTVGFVYALAHTANAIPEFRQRIRGEQVIEHDRVSPSVTILVDDDLFSFCTIPYCEDFQEFARRASAMIAHVKQHPSLENEPGRDDLLYMTALPWVSFTSFTHPMQLHPADSIPRFAWGKVFGEGERLKIPLSVQGHHALMDGIHIARYYAALDAYLQLRGSAGGG
jgi:chloramphenicol O-acetyltransferase type A